MCVHASCKYILEMNSARVILGRLYNLLVVHSSCYPSDECMNYANHLILKTKDYNQISYIIIKI